ncbi:MAG: DEAD/DEAH box helicase family protein [Crocinitomicaceae bacterium]|nr:DEAD/DEAH box helicase family protein [Crocinitomicaceae bacterium]
MSNFSFLHTEWSSLFSKMKLAEQRVYSEPQSTATYCRMCIEECIHTIYEVEYISLPYNTELLNLMKQEEIRAIIPADMETAMHYVRKAGNNAVHYSDKKFNKNDAETAIRYTYDFLKWFAKAYSQEDINLPGAFDKSFIPKVGAERAEKQKLQQEFDQEREQLLKELASLKAEQKATAEKAQKSEAAFKAFKEKETKAKTANKEKRLNRALPKEREYSEAETRVHLIDVDLKEAGWTSFVEGRDLERPVKGMPVTADNPNGNGFVDYVLWDDNGKPLGLVEAKKTAVSPEQGKHQASLYADCLEKEFDQRPIIFYSNGYTTNIWDDTFYAAPRRVYGFYSKDELRWLIQQRGSRQDVRLTKPKNEIVNRPYQHEAIQRIMEDLVVDGKDGLRGNKRKMLVVMATGSGKTRTAAALVDLLFKNSWVKRVLFLADRTPLVRQAKRSFNDNLSSLTSVNLVEEKEDAEARVVFSTYQTMINKIDKVKDEKGRYFGVGHFDLIILDEAHRSIYNKYQAIFEYFDAIQVGLTATPKSAIDHNTYEIFDCENDDPTFFYPLEEAVPKYLVPYKNIDVKTKFIREGIKYAELSEVDKKKYEETFKDKATGLFPEEIHSSAMNKKLFNSDTVDKVLDALMQNGLKIEGGDKLGRTIIFAVNQDHAEFIVERFEKRYPEQPSGFIKTVHNKVSHAQSIIDAFCDEHRELLPQIAVSVDMMDTGIDAHRVLNLVFFKVVRSYAKFWQMIGRGTRQCPDVYGPGRPKELFLIFDVCQNFDFFDEHEKGYEGHAIKPLSQQLFDSRLQLSKLLVESGLNDNIILAQEIRDILHGAIVNLDMERFQVKMAREYVDQFKERSKWNDLSTSDIHIIEEHLSKLPPPFQSEEKQRRFNLLMTKLQIASLLELDSKKGYQDRLLTIANILSKKYTIPQVVQNKKLIEQMKNPDFYKQLSQRKMEQIRNDIGQLMKFIEAESSEPVYTNIEDSEVEITVNEPTFIPPTGGIYRERVEKFIREHKDQLIIHKLFANEPITEQELEQLEKILFDGEDRGTRDDFKAEYGDQPLGAFVRSIIGLDVQAANEAFSKFIQSGELSADQMTFIQQIIDFLTQNGTIDPKLLFKSPFDEQHDGGLLGVFKGEDAKAQLVIEIVKRINENAEVG